MADYTVVFARSARKELESLPEPFSSRILARIESLAVTPRPSGVRKMEGAGDLWRLRVGDYRVIYEIDDRRRLIDISAVRHRKNAYR